MMESITWIQRRGQIKHLLYEMCLTGRIDRETLAETFKDLNNVAPVKHGRWIAYGLEEGFALERYTCSECDYDIGVMTHAYCPWCSARMDGEENDHR